jgi:SAM-dependent methyltransferase
MPKGGMRATWDAAAASDRVDEYVGDPATARAELEGLFGRLGADPRAGTCVEVGCGPGRMTSVLAERFDRVVAVDVSAGMLARARAAVTAPNVDFRLVGGDRLDSVEAGIADAMVCYLVLQHLPERRVVLRYLEEFARVLSPTGSAFVQIPVLRNGIGPRAWRIARALAVPVSNLFRRGVTDRAAYRGTRLTEGELQAGLSAAGLRTAARDESPESPYRYAREVFLRLERTA